MPLCPFQAFIPGTQRVGDFKIRKGVCVCMCMNDRGHV